MSGSSQARLRLVFCGTPDFAVPSLEALISAGHSIALVVTQPDRPVGRKQVLTAPAVKLTALAHGIPVTQPEKIKNNLEFRGSLEAIAPDAIMVVAYGRIIPKWMLDLPRLGCINLHGSLLPKFRGAAPIQWAIASGEAVTGNTTMLLEEGLDTGPMLQQRSLSIGPDETAPEVSARMAAMGAPMVVETLAGLADGSIVPVRQEDAKATLARILTREDGRVDFERHSAAEIWDRWRGFQPWPGAFSTIAGKKLILHRIRVSEAVSSAAEPWVLPGTLSMDASRIGGAGLYVACAGPSRLELIELQIEGRNRVTAAEFWHSQVAIPGTAGPDMRPVRLGV